VLDSLPSALAVLPAMRAAVGAQMPLLVDGGIRSGSDVVKALALGAQAVLVGRPQMHALAVGGVTGVAHLLHLLRAELELAMAQLGCPTVAAITPACLFTPTSSFTPGHNSKQPFT
jgi:4-hydroxymandelate oxidase